VYSLGILPGSRYVTAGAGPGGPGDHSKAGGVGEGAGGTGKDGELGAPYGVGGGKVVTEVAGRNRATSPFNWRHASIAYQKRNPAPAMARPMKTREMRTSSPTPPIPAYVRERA
jgi:hypothetical protein